MNFLPLLLDGNVDLYLRIIREGIAVRSHYDLLKWLQGDMQRYLPHEIMLAVWIETAENRMEYDVVSALPGVRTGFLRPEKLFTLQRELYGLWHESGNMPYRQSLDARGTRFENHRPRNITGEVFHGMRSLLVHGISDERAGQDCLYIAFHSRDGFNDTALSVMENLLPYLDTALRRITPLRRQQRSALFPSDSQRGRRNYGLSTREAEILDWIRLGKTNPEIAIILEISACTVKNHVQNIFRKLDVYNRVQAIAKIDSVPVIVPPVSLLPAVTVPLRACPLNISPLYRSIKQLA